MADLKHLIAKAANGEPLTRDEARTAFDVLMSGEATPSQIGGFLMALRVRGETVDEITGAVETMREKMTEGRSARRCDRHRRHRRRCLGFLQHLDLCGLHRRRRRASRSPSTAIARCRRNRERPMC